MNWVKVLHLVQNGLHPNLLLPLFLRSCFIILHALLKEIYTYLHVYVYYPQAARLKDEKLKPSFTELPAVMASQNEGSTAWMQQFKILIFF